MVSEIAIPTLYEWIQLQTFFTLHFLLKFKECLFYNQILMSELSFCVKNVWLNIYKWIINFDILNFKKKITLRFVLKLK